MSVANCGVFFAAHDCGSRNMSYSLETLYPFQKIGRLRNAIVENMVISSYISQFGFPSILILLHIWLHNVDRQTAVFKRLEPCLSNCESTCSHSEAGAWFVMLFAYTKGLNYYRHRYKRAWRSKTSQLALERRFVNRACAVEEVTEAQSFEARGPFVSWVLVLNTLYKQLYRLASVSPEIIQ